MYLYKEESLNTIWKISPNIESYGTRYLMVHVYTCTHQELNKKKEFFLKLAYIKVTFNHHLQSRANLFRETKGYVFEK